jgi:hypothetical protein
LVPAAVIANFVAFNVLTAAWTGGWGVGPRYLVPALPFLMALAVPGYRRFPRLATALIVISVFMMLTVTAVRVQWPAKLYGPPVGDDPVAESLVLLLRGLIARDPGSTNIGLRLGLPGTISLLPPLLVIAALGIDIAWLSRRDRATALRADAAHVAG